MTPEEHSNEIETQWRAEEMARKLHDECCKGCERPVDGSWVRFGEAVANGEMTYALAVKLLDRRSNRE